MQTSNNSSQRSSQAFNWKQMRLSPKLPNAGIELVDSTKKLQKKVIPESCTIAGKEASRYAKHFDKHSALLQRQKTVDVLRWSDLDVGELIGRGAFSNVFEVRLKGNVKQSSPQMMTSGALEASDTSLDVSEIFHNSSIYTDVDAVTYALKCIDPINFNGEKDFSNCAIDLVMEAKILACLNHPNIATLHAVTGGSIPRAFTRKHGYFIVLERLQESLSERMGTWAETESLLSKMERIVRLEDRLTTVVQGVAHGMNYIHQNNVIYRDLKPSNVGFTSTGTVKLFDFGLAREILDSSRKLTGYAGSSRYMAPEVARSDFYGLPADVYSFAILVWELCSLDTAFAGMSKQEHMERVVGSHMRPKLSSIEGSYGLKTLIQSCWSHDPDRRPTFCKICDVVSSKTVFEGAGSSRGPFKNKRHLRMQKQRIGSMGSKLSLSLPSTFDIVF